MIRYAVGVDIGGSHIASCIIDLHSDTIIKNTVIKKSVNNQASPSEILNVWTLCIQESITHSKVEPDGIGFAFPGPFDYERGICLIEGVNKFNRLFGLDITSTLRTYLKLPEKVEFRYVNDAGAFALGEASGGCARGFKRVLALTLGTGVGSGFIADRQLVVSGPTVPWNGWVYHLPFEDTIADNAFSTRWFCHRYEEISHLKVSGAKEIAEKASQEPLARQIFQEYGCRLADFLIPLSEQFKPEAIVLGGNISQAFCWFGPYLQERLQQQGKKTEILVSELRDDAAMIGAASLFYH